MQDLLFFVLDLRTLRKTCPQLPTKITKLAKEYHDENNGAAQSVGIEKERRISTLFFFNARGSYRIAVA